MVLRSVRSSLLNDLNMAISALKDREHLFQSSVLSWSFQLDWFIYAFQKTELILSEMTAEEYSYFLDFLFSYFYFCLCWLFIATGRFCSEWGLLSSCGAIVSRVCGLQ